MNITITLIVQGIAFFVVVLLVMRFGWPALTQAIAERQKTIADGLAAANRGQKDLDEARQKSHEIIREAREKAAQIVDQASKRANEIIDEAKHTAIAEGQRLVHQAQEEIALDVAKAREGLRKQVAHLAIEGASHLLEREIDPKAHAALLDKLELEIAGG
jgi:F-type H+-transporting ATPase subunit b